MIRLLAPAAFALAALHAPPAPAQTIEQFQSPTGNIHCMFVADGEAGPTLRCDIRQISNAPPPRPRNCDLEWGQAFEIAGRSRGARICYGDTVADASSPVLAYGEVWRRAGFTCFSAESGMTCRNSAGGGFELSRARQRVF